jgi:muconolactone delta-isomerase
MPNESYQQYMVDFTLPAILTERFTSRIPEQRALVNKYFKEGKLASYCVSLEKSKMWAIFNAETESEVFELLKSMPLIRFLHYNISPLTFHNSAVDVVPDFSMN